ncbi:MAG: hypothetical protein CMA45_05930 [Euryarchaeota archaeon]|nr:hypothetical protein [Euryarchaeota archaeon]MAR94591.1 hypothetical protein [Euryarchaeota archaeon]|tara:strand:- start:30 stop:1751 length:1722 start_codon:yes stop_codon:yes gene_type:complete
MSKKEVMDKLSHLFSQTETFLTSEAKKANRKNWSSNQKQNMIIRQETCLTCSEVLTQENISREHILPLVLGGRETEDNVVAMCLECNHARNKVMGKLVGHTKIEDLRSEWPGNREKICEYISWSWVSVSNTDYDLSLFPEFNNLFLEKRGILSPPEKPSQKIKKPSQKITLKERLDSWKSSIFKSKSNNYQESDKVKCKCLNPDCKKILLIPSNSKNRFICTVSQGGCGRTYNSYELLGHRENFDANDDVKKSDIVVEKTTKFDLKEWLTSNRENYESIEETYVGLKMAISSYEKNGAKRPVRTMLDEEYGLKRNLSLEKMYKELENYISEVDPIKSKNSPIVNKLEKKDEIEVTKNLNSSSGIRLPKNPEQFIQVMEIYLDNVDDLDKFSEIVSVIKEREIIAKSRVSTTLNVIQRAIIGHDTKDHISLQNAFTLVKDFEQKPSYENIVLGCEQSLLTCNYSDVEEFTVGVRNYFRQCRLFVPSSISSRLKEVIISNIPTDCSQIRISAALGSVSDHPGDFFQHAKSWRDVKGLLGFSKNKPFHEIILQLWPKTFTIELVKDAHFISLKNNA